MSFKNTNFFGLNISNVLTDLKSTTEAVTNLDLNKKDLDRIINITSKVHQMIGCRGITRSDFKFYKGKFYLLEINTQPGMTKLSLVPEIASYSGIKFEDLVVWMIKDASSNR